MALGPPIRKLTYISLPWPGMVEYNMMKQKKSGEEQSTFSMAPDVSRVPWFWNEW